ncbi:MAG: class I SAM-dependent methyltransferase [Myxococcales bacterium]|nr:class I SAM-dependent methyltransferase [Myxococcales bacterium]
MADTSDQDYAALYDRHLRGRWDEPVGDNLLRCLEIRQGTTCLVADCRTGYACDLVLSAAQGRVRVMAVDPSRAMLDTARESVVQSSSSSVFFNCQSTDSLTYADGVFGMVLCLSMPLVRNEFETVARELLRVVRMGGSVVVAGPTAGSLSVFNDMVLESARCQDDVALFHSASNFVGNLVNTGVMETILTELGAKIVAQDSLRLELPVVSTRDLLRDPLVKRWYAPLWESAFERQGQRDSLFADALKRTSTYFSGIDFDHQITASWFSLRKD